MIRCDLSGVSVGRVGRVRTARLQGKSAAVLGPFLILSQANGGGGKDMGAMERGLGQRLCSSRVWELGILSAAFLGPIRLGYEDHEKRVFGKRSKRILTSGSRFGGESGTGVALLLFCQIPGSPHDEPGILSFPADPLSGFFFLFVRPSCQ
ncbi:hypothetical protein CGRA01v4_07241 [Colletotrichum graminicola]|nr:hypothetical protein CGRA01v4_07241 [Colletotrichum graminicola]